MAKSPRKSSARTGNRLLDKVSPSDFKSLADKLETLHLPHRHVLLEADEPLDYVYFPVSSVLSLSVAPSPAERPSVEIASVGNEGMVGFTALLGVPGSFHQAACQVPGTCLRLPTTSLSRAMARRPAVDILLKRYMAVAYRTLIQSAVCNALHQVEQRICRLLLVTAEKAGVEFPVTQEALAARLGVQRPTISVVASALLKEGLITYHRGNVRILDQAKLEQAACECFQITKAVHERILEH